MIEKNPVKWIKGTAEWFAETGTEGVLWAVYEDGKEGYDGLNIIKPGDFLRIWNTDGSIAFEGTIEPDYEKHISCVCWVHWTQKGWDPNKWGELFCGENLKALLRPLVKEAFE